MELNVRNRSVLRVASLIKELARDGVGGADLGATGRNIITKLLEVVLEHIDDLIRLELALNAWRYAINKDI